MTESEEVTESEDVTKSEDEDMAKDEVSKEASDVPLRISVRGIRGYGVGAMRSTRKQK